MRVDTEDGIKAVAGMNPRIMKVLGSNLYSGDLGKIAVKELLQNAADILRGLSKGGRIKLWINTEDGVRITIQDNGLGMTPKVATEEMVDIGGTYKIEGSSGGFGIAKVAIFSNAERILVETIAQDGEGRTKTTLEGSADDWLDTNKGLRVTTSSSTSWTGTRIEVKLKKDVRAGSYEIANFLQTFLDTNRLPFKFEFYFNNSMMVARRDRARFAKQIVGPGMIVDFYANKKMDEATGTHVQILNHGLPQFDHYVSFLENAKTPTKIIADIKSNASPDEPDYPFRPDREGLRSDAESLIKRFIRESIYTVAVTQQRSTLQEALSSGYRVWKDQQIQVLDSQMALAKTQVNKIGRAPYMKQLAWTLDKATEMLLNAINQYSEYSKVQFGGISLSNGYEGLYIPTDKDSLILINPYRIAGSVLSLVNQSKITEDEAICFFARKITSVLVHEITHKNMSGHYQNFADELTSNMARTLDQQQHIVRDLTYLLQSQGKSVWKEIVEHYQELTKVWTDKNDVLVNAGIS